MKKLAAFVLAAGLLLGGTARADDMYVPGLGTLPFSAAVQVKDGDGTAVEQMFRKSLAYPAAAGTKRAAFMRFLSTPEGMTVANGTAESPAAQSRLYQLVKEEPAGTYTMTVVVFSGDGDELFNARHKKEQRWWDNAFRPGSPPEGRAQVLITLDEFREAARRSMDGKSGAPVDFQILGASPWKRYNNDDGTVRWQQNVKFVIDGQNGLIVPMWMESVLYRNAAGRYYFLIFTGSHESGRQFEDDLLYALYRIGRELV